MERKKYGTDSPLRSVENKSKPALKTVLFKCMYFCEEREQVLPGCCPYGCWSLRAPAESKAVHEVTVKMAVDL